MVTTSQHLTVPSSLVEAIERYIRHEIPLVELRGILSDAIQKQPAYASTIHAVLDDKLENRRLTIVDYGELIVGMGEILSEDIPTDCSDAKPDTSGVYRIINPKTMILEETNLQEVQSSSRESTDAEVVEEVKPSAVTGADDAALNFPREGLVLRERFRLDKKLGRGSMGEVFLATDLLQVESNVEEPWIAVKVIQPELAENPVVLQALHNEIVSSQQLSHPNIIHLFDFDHDAHLSYVTMEWLKGETLAEFLDAGEIGGIDRAAAQQILCQLGDALTYAHDQGVVHADVKPGNVFLCDSGVVKLLDFGLARMASDVIADTDAALLNGVLTPAYSSCERLEHNAATIQDDVYSYACLVYRLLAGSRPFGALTALDAEARNMAPVQPSGMLDSRWEAICAGLEFRKEKRTTSIAELVSSIFPAPKPAVLDVELSVLTAAVKPLEINELEAQQDSVIEIATPIVDGPVAKVSGLTVKAEREQEHQKQESLNQEKEPRIVFLQPSRAKQLRQNISFAYNRFVFKFVSSRALIALRIALVAALAVLVITSFLKDAPDGANQIAVAELNVTAESIPVRPTANSMLVVPSTESILIVERQPERATKQSWRSAVATKPKVKERTVQQPPTSAVRQLPAPQPEEVARSVRNAELERDSGAFNVVPKPAAADALTEALVSFLTEVRIRSGGVDAAENIVTTVNTAPIPSNVEHAFVKNIDFSIASGNLDQVVTTVSSSEIDLVGVVMTVRGAPVDELPLSALDFDRYVEPEAPGQGLRAGSGWVDVNFSVDARGRTADVTIADSNLPSRFNAPVLTSVKKWRFKPYERNGKAVSIRSSARLRFQP